MSATATHTPTRKRIAIGRYAIDAGERLVVAVCRGDVVDQLLDVPRTGAGPVYVIESDLQSGDRLRPLVKDYIAQADRLGHCPMSRAGLAAMLANGEGRIREAIS